MGNPFAKKPDDEEKTAPEGAAPEEKPAAPGAPTDKPTDAPAAAGAPTGKPGKPGKPSAGGDGAAPKGKGGNSAPITPNQGVPDVKPHDVPGAKAEAEESPQGKDELPDETDDSQAKEKPKGLPSLATTGKEEAMKDPGGKPDPTEHIGKLMAIVEGLANHVKGMGATPGAAGGANTQGAMNVAKGLPGKPMTPAGAMRPGMAKPGMGMKPGMGGGMRPGMGAGVGGAPMPAKMLTMEQITGLMSIIEAANTGRIPRAGAALLIAQGFGMDPQTAMAMVSPDAQAAGPEGALSTLGGGEAVEEGAEEEASLFDGPDALNPEEEELEQGGEEEFEGDPNEEEEPAKKRAFGANWDFKKLDAVDQIDDAVKRLEGERKNLDARIDAVERTIEVIGSPFV